MMKPCSAIILTALFLVRDAACDREVVFLGLSGEGAPSIGKTFNRLFQENLAVMPGIHVAGGDELERLRAGIDGSSYPAVTPMLIETLGRIVSDTALVIWGKIKVCSVGPVRRFFVGAAIRGDLGIELAIYSLADRDYVFVGDVSASAERWKELIMWKSPETAVHVSAADRAAIIDTVLSEAAFRGGRVLESVVLSEASRKARNASLSAEEKKTGKPAGPVSADTASRSNPPDAGGSDSMAADTTADAGPADSSAARPTGETARPKPRDSE